MRAYDVNVVNEWKNGQEYIGAFKASNATITVLGSGQSEYSALECACSCLRLNGFPIEAVHILENENVSAEVIPDNFECFRCFAVISLF
jgi:hypothetical protein